LSFKDRGAAVLMAKAKSLGAGKVIADSSGNAGTAIAAYAARCNIACDIYLSDVTSPKKMAQVKAHGAEIRQIEGTRQDIAAAAQRRCLKRLCSTRAMYTIPISMRGRKHMRLKFSKNSAVRPTH